MTPPETVNRAPHDPSAAASPIRILLVEDDDGDALLVEELLDISGARVEITRAATLAEALRADLQAIDCVLLDLDLPDAQGLSALHRLKTDRADLAVLVLTGLDDDQRGNEAVGAGAQDYLVKGQIDGQGLARAVRYAVERQSADEARQQLEGARLPAGGDGRPGGGPAARRGERAPGARPAACAARQRPAVGPHGPLPSGPPARAAGRGLLRR